MAFETQAVDGKLVQRFSKENSQVATNGNRYGARCPDCGTYLQVAEIAARIDPLSGKQGDRYELRGPNGEAIKHCGKEIEVVAERSPSDFVLRKRPTFYTVQKTLIPRLFPKKRRLDLIKQAQVEPEQQ